MKKTIGTLILLFVMFTNLNATEAPSPKSDANCTVEKCKTKKANDANCTLVKCKAEKKSDCKDCDGKGCEKCKTTAKWSAAQDTNSTMKMSACCKNKKNKEVKVEPKEEKPMKCAAGKCGGGKCGGK